MKLKNIFILILLVLSAVFQGYAKTHDILFPAKKNGLWGYINISGEWVIKAQYFKAFPFTEGLAAVKEYSKWGFIDKNGEWIITPHFEQAAPFEEGLASVVLNGRWGFIDDSGQFIIEPTYEKASSFSEGLAVVANNNHFRYINHTGNVVLDGAFTSASPFAEGLAMVSWEDRNGFINSNGQLQIAHNFTNTGLFSEGLARIKIQSKWGYMDRSGNTSIVPVYEKNGHFSEHLAPARQDNKWGFINKRGAWEIKSKFESVAAFQLGYAIAKHSGKWGIINHSGEWVVKPKYESIGNAGKSVGLKEEIKEHIQSAYASWRTKGEFETSALFTLRMQENQQVIMDSLSNKIIKEYGDKLNYSSQPTLGYYNADHEYFTFFTQGILPANVSVPLEQAREFKTNWEQAIIINTNYNIVGKYFMLTDFAVALNGALYNSINSYSDATLSGISWADEILVPEVTWKIADESSTQNDVRIAAKPGTSDVDFDIPEMRIENKNTFALIIGNEDYKSYQGGFNSEINVTYAVTDATVFSKYVNKTLGVPKKNITLLKNATAGQIKQALAKMNKIAKAFEGKAEFIFYYAGHGLPDELSRKPYLVPVDVNGSDLSFAISLDEALSTLAEHPHMRITVFLDACFTGGGRNESLVSSRGVKIRPKSPFVKGNLVMFSASGGNQTAFAYDEKAHGMFTYFLLKKLKETKGRVTYIELAEYLETQVGQNAIITNNKEQTPEVMVSPSLEDVWERFSLPSPYKPEVITSSTK